MMKKIVIYSFLTLLLIGLGCGVWYVYYARQCCGMRSPVDVTIFIHGTVGTEFNVFSPFHCLSDTASEDTLSTRLSRKFRSHPYLQHEQLLGPEGMIEVPYHKILTYRKHDTKDIDTQNAWYHIISSYDAIAQKVGVVSPCRHYLLYGWDGLLSNRARKRAGYDLYNQLRAIYHRIVNAYGCSPRIHIVAHSHGGNVALWAAQAAHEDGDPFAIDMLFMMGTPIQQETINLVRYPFYTTIISSYSYGDNIQGSDYFSTSYHQSYQRMSDLIDISEASRVAGGLRADMQYVVNLQHHVVTHANMWLIGRSEPVLDAMSPLPLVAIVPVFFAHLNSHARHTHYQAHLHGSRGYCVGQIVANDSPVRTIAYRSPNMYPEIYKAQSDVRSMWNPVDDSRHLVFNYKNFSAMRHAFGV